MFVLTCLRNAHEANDRRHCSCVYGSTRKNTNTVVSVSEIVKTTEIPIRIRVGILTPILKPAQRDLYEVSTDRSLLVGSPATANGASSGACATRRDPPLTEPTDVACWSQAVPVRYGRDLYEVSTDRSLLVGSPATANWAPSGACATWREPP